MKCSEYIALEQKGCYKRFEEIMMDEGRKYKVYRILLVVLGISMICGYVTIAIADQIHTRPIFQGQSQNLAQSLNFTVTTSGPYTITMSYTFDYVGSYSVSGTLNITNTQTSKTTYVNYHWESTNSQNVETIDCSSTVNLSAGPYTIARPADEFYITIAPTSWVGGATAMAWMILVGVVCICFAIIMRPKSTPFQSHYK